MFSPLILVILSIHLSSFITSIIIHRHSSSIVKHHVVGAFLLGGCRSSRGSGGGSVPGRPQGAVVLGTHVSHVQCAGVDGGRVFCRGIGLDAVSSVGGPDGDECGQGCRMAEARVVGRGRAGC